MTSSAREGLLSHQTDGAAKAAAPGLRQIAATVLFTDIEDSTGLARTLGVNGIAQFLRRHCELVESCVRAHQGVFLGCTGDGVLAFWGDAPTPHAEPARRALLAAADLGRRITEENLCRQAAGLPTRRVRVGIHSGEVGLEEGRKSGDLPRLYGATAHEARRIEQAGKKVVAAGEEVVVMTSESTLRLAHLGTEVIRRPAAPQAYNGCPHALCRSCSAIQVDPAAVIASLSD